MRPVEAAACHASETRRVMTAGGQSNEQHCAGLTSPSLPFLPAVARARCWGASWPRCGWAPGIPAAEHRAELSCLARQRSSLSCRHAQLRRLPDCSAAGPDGQLSASHKGVPLHQSVLSAGQHASRQAAGRPAPVCNSCSPTGALTWAHGGPGQHAHLQAFKGCAVQAWMGVLSTWLVGRILLWASSNRLSIVCHRVHIRRGGHQLMVVLPIRTGGLKLGSPAGQRRRVDEDARA